MPKLAAILLVPVVAIGLLTWLRLQDEAATVRTLDAVHRGQELADQAATIATAVQGERSAAVAFIAGNREGGSSADLAAANRSVDAAADGLQSAASSLDSLPSGVRNAVQTSLADLDSLTAVRAAVMSTKFPASSAFTSYSTMAASLLQLNRAVAGSISDASATPLAEALRALTDGQEQVSEQGAVLLSAAQHGRFPPGLAAELRAAQSRFDADQNAFDQVASADERQRFQNTVAGPPVDELTQLTQQALLQDAAGQPVTISTAAIQRDAGTTADLVRQVAISVDHELDAAITALSAAAIARAWRDGIAVVAFVLLALIVMLLVARSLLKPLGVLRRTALAAAHERLPAVIAHILSASGSPATAAEQIEPVPVRTKEEVGQLARAFDVVLREAVHLAGEQAALRSTVNAMFVNLSRRSQNLVQRQIEVLDHLEQNEQDPDQLAQFFELDHLATRMRRYSENLLVLAGASADQRIGQAVAVVDVFGGAVSEVEQYQHITVADPPEAAVQSRAAKDLVHLLAELLENATDYSHPVTKVTVRSILTRSGALRIEILDRGVGMSEVEIDRANERLAAPPAVDVAVSRQMGLHVVGQLAQRHGIAVTLRANLDIDGGMTAQIIVPSTVLERLPVLPSAPPAQVPAPAIQEHSSPRSAPSLFTPQPLTDDHAGAEPEWPRDEQFTEVLAAAPQPEPEQGDETPTGRLPIYQEVISRWFRPDEDLDVPVSADPPADDAPDATTAVTNEAVVESAPSPEHDLTGVSDEQLPRAWSSPADEGWKTVTAVLEQPATHSLTTAGLPKRVPKTHLLPGSAAIATAEPPSPAANSRLARSFDPRRVAAFQRSADQGRHAQAAGGADQEHR